jgi:hypothetical protein
LGLIEFGAFIIPHSRIASPLPFIVGGILYLLVAFSVPFTAYPVHVFGIFGGAMLGMAARARGLKYLYPKSLKL